MVLDAERIVGDCSPSCFIDEVGGWATLFGATVLCSDLASAHS
jgi:hypothetical protein